MHPHEGNGSLEDWRLQIAVTGGSIGGLCAGLALHGSGFDVNVICAPLPRNAGRTGTSQRPNSKRRGSKAARNSSIRTAKRTSKLSVNRIRIWDFRFPILECGADSNRRNIETEAGHRPDRTIKAAVIGAGHIAARNGAGNTANSAKVEIWLRDLDSNQD
jgi:hypothetical protein